jgi:hypothetical protein
MILKWLMRWQIKNEICGQIQVRKSMLSMIAMLFEFDSFKENI